MTGAAKLDTESDKRVSAGKTWRGEKIEEKVENDRSTDAEMSGLLLETCVINFSPAFPRLNDLLTASNPLLFLTSPPPTPFHLTALPELAPFTKEMARRAERIKRSFFRLFQKEIVQRSNHRPAFK
ncbi:hypothetical protein ACOMHN_010968 [Nucella lapillus]